MEAHEFAKKIYLSGAANSASSLLQGLRHDGLIECSDELLQATAALGRGLASQKETCSCLVAAAMAAGIDTSRSQNRESGNHEAEKISAQIIEEIRKKYKTTRYCELLDVFRDIYSQ